MKKRGVRYFALKALWSVEKREGHSQKILHQILEKNPLSLKDRGLLTHIFYGVLQRKKTLDYSIHTYSRRGTEGMDPLLKNILRIGCYQLLYLDRVPAYAAINETVELTHHYRERGWSSFVNALLRRLHREGIELPSGESLEDLAVRYSHPPWIIKHFLTMYTSDETFELLNVNNSIPTLSLRVQTLRCTREELLEDLKREGVKARSYRGLPEAILVESPISLKKLSSFQKGYFYIQGLAAMVASHLLGGEEGESILDLCAGVGGKATHLAQLTKDKARILAIDSNEDRLRLLEENCTRLGLHSIETLCCDARTYSTHNLFHRVLVDAPCSDLGLLGRRPEIRWYRREEDIASLKNLQQALLEKAASLVKRRGYLLYATCTLSQEENEGVVKDFLESHRGFSLLHGEEILKICSIGFLPQTSRKGLLEYRPQKEGSEGFFLALFQRD